MSDQPNPEKQPAKQDVSNAENKEKTTPPASKDTSSAQPASPAASSVPPAPKPPAEGDAAKETPSTKPVTPDSSLGQPAAPTNSASEPSKDKSAPGETSKEASQPARPAGSATRIVGPPSDTGSLTPDKSASSGQICPTCGHRNRPGVLICENCGTNLSAGSRSSVGTRDLVREQQINAAENTGNKVLDTGEVKAVQSAGTGSFTEDMMLRVEIEGGTTPMVVYPKQEIILGRRDPNTGGMPDVDLTTYAGYRMGVSRRHSAIRLQDKQLNVSDLGSSNGTFLNGTRLTAHRPYQIHDGDEIRLGQMVLRVYFQTSKDKK